jgi:hypothetical protein
LNILVLFSLSSSSEVDSFPPSFSYSKRSSDEGSEREGEGRRYRCFICDDEGELFLEETGVFGVLVDEIEDAGRRPLLERMGEGEEDIEDGEMALIYISR